MLPRFLLCSGNYRENMLKLILGGHGGSIMEFKKIFKIMNESFQNNEMRTYESQRKLLKNENYRMYTEYDDNDGVIGFLAYWSLKSCIFFEHLAISKNQRGKGIGTKIILKHIKNAEKPVFLEVHPPVTALAKRRINLYKRLGFNLNHFYYEQPALRENESSQQLMIMSYPKSISETDFNKYKNEIYNNVYNVKPC